MGRIPVIEVISERLLRYNPDLEQKLVISEINKLPGEFMDWVVGMALIMAVIMGAISYMIINAYLMPVWWAGIVFIVTLVAMYYYFLNYPSVYMFRKRRTIEYDIVFATKHMIIGLSSGMPLFDSLAGVTKGYGEISKEFRKIVDRVTLGEPLTFVLRDVAEKTPSPAFKRVLIQIANAVVSGADIAQSLDAVVNHISQEQILTVKEYGQKMNPLIMFYLIIGVIFPTLGITFIMVLMSFVGKGITFPLVYLLLVSAGIGLLQFLFLAYVESSRPRYALLTS